MRRSPTRERSLRPRNEKTQVGVNGGMPQCKECFKPIVTGVLCRPCREERMDPDDVTQEIPFPEDEDIGWATSEDRAEELPQAKEESIRAWHELLGIGVVKRQVY